jgi:hypothetical protein
LKANKSEIFSLIFEDVAQTSKSGFESISKLRSSILERLNGSFDQSEKQGGNVFDVSKLEALKEQGNKNFFEKMQEIKQGKTVVAQKDGHGQSNTSGASFLELDFGGQSAPINHKPVAQTQSSSDHDILIFDPVQQPKPIHPSLSTKQGNDFDLLNDFSSNLNIGNQQSKLANSDNLPDFIGHTTTTQTSHQQPNYAFNNSAFEVNFDSKPTLPKPNDPSPPVDYKQINFTLLASNDDKTKNGKKDKDPFDFIVF